MTDCPECRRLTTKHEDMFAEYELALEARNAAANKEDLGAFTAAEQRMRTAKEQVDLIRQTRDEHLSEHHRR